ncbi:hypothetical protein QQF64_034547 [Cirrhinus molitorella]|uniref:Uncharacterized protein n=1 Tax=Cirrhinus molitorella TaxID=172907 RepID=A0ABR3L4H7_9TELE
MAPLAERGGSHSRMIRDSHVTNLIWATLLPPTNCPHNVCCDPHCAIIATHGPALAERVYAIADRRQAVPRQFAINQTQHLGYTKLCQPRSEVCILSCGSTEAVIRLALSAVVGVAAVAVLVHDIRS